MAEEIKIKKIDFADRPFIVLKILVMGILFFLGAKLYIDFKNLPVNFPQQISVSAEGKSSAVPDIAQVRLGVETEGLVVKNVIGENSEKMNALLKEIKALGIEEKDIKTSRYNLAPRYEFTKNGERIFKGYVLNNEITVKVRKFEKLGDVLDKSSQVGANVIGDLQFTIEDLEKIRETARKEAIDEAKTKAKKIAEQTGLKLVKLVNVYENFTPPIASPYVLTKEAVGGGFAAAPEIRPGEEEISVTVTLVYQIK